MLRARTSSSLDSKPLADHPQYPLIPVVLPCGWSRIVHVLADALPFRIPFEEARPPVLLDGRQPPGLFSILSDPRPDLLAGDSIGYRERPAFIALSMDCATAPVPGFFLSARMAGLNPSSALQPQSLMAQKRLNPGRGQKCAALAAAPATAL